MHANTCTRIDTDTAETDTDTYTKSTDTDTDTESDTDTDTGKDAVREDIHTRDSERENLGVEGVTLR